MVWSGFGRCPLVAAGSKHGPFGAAPLTLCPRLSNSVKNSERRGRGGGGGGGNTDNGEGNTVNITTIITTTTTCGPLHIASL